MYLCMDYIKFILEALGVKTLTGALLFCGGAPDLWQFADTFLGASIRDGVSNCKDITGVSYMNQWTRSSLVQATQTYCQSDRRVPKRNFNQSTNPHEKHLTFSFKWCYLWSSFHMLTKIRSPSIATSAVLTESVWLRSWQDKWQFCDEWDSGITNWRCTG